MLVWFCLLGLLHTGESLICSQCDSVVDPDCMENPPAPQNCTSCANYSKQSGLCTHYVNMKYCIVERRYINDTLTRVTRDCSPALMREKCDFTVEHDQLYKVCFYTCRQSGCNMNAASPMWASIQNCIAMVTVLLFSCRWILRTP